jgi:epoxyqueuosine reductase
VRARLTVRYDRVLGYISSNWKLRMRMRFIPPVLFLRYRRLYRPRRGAWPEFTTPTPPVLLGMPGIRRDPEAEEASFAEQPIQDYPVLYPKGTRIQYQGMARELVPTTPRFMRGVNAAVQTGVRTKQMARSRADEPVDPDALDDTAELTARVRAEAARIGLSAIGIAEYDPKYTFEQMMDEEVGDRVIICVLEQNYEATQLAPASRAEKAAMAGYSETMKFGAALARFIQSQGYRAVSTSPHSTGIMLHYGVQAGLGQLGFNGQLLTPYAGSRCRLVSISTDAPLDLDAPRDFGINKICDDCQACVRRCPGQAIPRKRRFHRGVEKSKINTRRCLPLVAQAEGCAVCMKVCPVQRYGLDAVYEEYEKSGTILGTGTDELEGFTFTDGRHYPPGEMPQLPREYFFDLT